MPAISNKGRQMPESPIRKLVPYAEAAAKAGKKIYYLNIGQPDIETPTSMLDAVKNTDMKVLAYSHSAGFESYRKKLVGYYNQFNISLDHTNILITTGGSEAILFAFGSCLDAGDEIIIPEPFYANYNGFAVASGIKIVPVTSKIENGFALPPVSEIEKTITSKTKAILICNPNNPTGYLYKKEELEALRNIVKKHDLFLFSDEVYREFCYDGLKHHSVMNLDGLEENVVLLDSISKRYSACGARVGALISKNKEVVAAALKFGQARLSPPSLAQIVAEAASEVPPAYLKTVKEEYTGRRDILVEELNKIEGVLCPNPGGAFYTFVRLPIDNSDKFCQWILESFDHNNQTVMIAPASGFYATPGLGKDEVRIAYVLNKKDLKSAIECLDEALKVYPGRVIKEPKTSLSI